MQPTPLATLVSGTQLELGQRLGIHQTEVSRVLRGMKVLPTRSLARLIQERVLTAEQVVGLVLWMAEVDQALGKKSGRRARLANASDGMSATEAEAP